MKPKPFTLPLTFSRSNVVAMLSAWPKTTSLVLALISRK